METISYKVESGVADELEHRAAAQSGASRHTVARQMLLEVLMDADRLRVLQEIELLRNEVVELRNALATGVAALLVQAGKVYDPKDAEEWVRRTMLPK